MRFPMMKLAAAGLAAAVLATAMPTDAEAGYRHRGHGGAAAAAGIIGFGVGAMLGSAMAQPRGYYYYDPAPPVHYRPAPRVYYQYAPAPWTPDWYAYCHSKYRSFDPHSGTYMTYQGYRRFCE